MAIWPSQGDGLVPSSSLEGLGAEVKVTSNAANHRLWGKGALRLAGADVEQGLSGQIGGDGEFTR